MLTFMACCIKSIAISRPNNSPATRVNLLIIEHAPNTASKKSNKAVHTQTLRTHKVKEILEYHQKSHHAYQLRKFVLVIYHPVQAKKRLGPKSFLSFAKSNINVYINTVGSATPSMSRGCPPTIEWMMPQSAVDTRVCTAVNVPSVKCNQK